MESIRGQFLVASPHLSDPNFYRSVVLMIQHDDEGAFGLLLNRPTEQTVRELWEFLDDEECACDEFVRMGGPVSGPVTTLHTDPELAEDEVFPGVYFAARKDLIDRLVASDARPLLLMSGYSGWGSGQLDSELDSGGWLVADATDDEVFADPDEMWDIIARRINLDILGRAVTPAAVPQDASLN